MSYRLISNEFQVYSETGNIIGKTGINSAEILKHELEKLMTERKNAIIAINDAMETLKGNSNLSVRLATSAILIPKLQRFISSEILKRYTIALLENNDYKETINELFLEFYRNDGKYDKELMTINQMIKLSETHPYAIWAEIP